MKQLLLLIAFVFGSMFTSFGQSPKEHKKGSYVDEKQNYYQQAELPLYIYVSHDPNKTPTQLPLKNKSAENGVEMKEIYLDGHGVHHLKHSEGNSTIPQIFEVYADGIAPKSKVAFQNAPHHFGNGTHFYGKGLSLAVSTKDEMSGIETLYHATNQSEYAAYASEKNFDQEGAFDFRYYAVDKVGNAEKVHVHNFTVDLTAPSTFHNVVGVAKGNIISTSTKIYLTYQDSVSGVAKTYYRLDDGDYKQYKEGTNIPFLALNDGDHTLTYYSVDHVNNKEKEASYDFYLDKTAPIMSSDVIGDKFVVGEKVYFSGRTKLKLTAVDNKAGIKEVRYSVDGEDFKDYTEPFYLPSKSGQHVIRYYALDNMSNQASGSRDLRYAEYRHNVSKVFVDLTGPILKHNYKGVTFQKGNEIFVSGDTKITITGTDPEAGLQYLSYRVDGKGDEIKYGESFSIPESGEHTIDYYGYDNVNNRNANQFKLIVDNTPPEIEETFSVQPIAGEGDAAIYPSYVTIFLACTDELSGYKNITYSINGGPDKVYSKPITALKKDTAYVITVKATDKLNNTKTMELKFKTTDY